MKVYSLYYKDTFVAAFPERKDAIFYGKQFYEDAWDCNIVEEYLSKSPLVYTPPHYTPLTSPNTIPCISPVISKSPVKYCEMKSFNINETVKVRLTKFGKELHKKRWEDFWNSHGKLNKFPYEPPKEDENGYCEFQMWDLMEKFGNHCGLCKELAFETVILIDEEDLK